MFNKLLISTNERRKGRTAKFFCGTATTYAMVIVGMLALSVVISNPKLADTGERMLALVTPLPPPGPPPPRQRDDNTPPPVQPQNDPNHITDLDRVLAMPPKPLPKPELLSDDFSSNSAPGSIGTPGANGPGVPGSNAQDETTPPPPQPVTPRATPSAPQVDTTRPVRLPSKVLQGKALVRHTPDYPPLAKQIHLSGSVSVEVMIGLDGRVEAARAVSGHQMFVTPAVEAARGWRFEPTFLNGIPVRVSGVIVFNFTME